MTDTTEKVEKTETGYKLTVKSTRGNDVRDQDKVEATAKVETLEELKEERADVTATVKASMEDMRMFDPDGEDDE